MSRIRPSWQAVLAVLLCVLAALLGPMTAPEAQALADPTVTINYPYVGTRGLIFLLPIIAALASMAPISTSARAVAAFIGANAAAWLLVGGIAGFEGTACNRIMKV